jgi:hypothetical protein
VVGEYVLDGRSVNILVKRCGEPNLNGHIYYFDDVCKAFDEKIKDGLWVFM